jgi:hypothetical protein
MSPWCFPHSAARGLLLMWRQWETITYAWSNRRERRVGGSGDSWCPEIQWGITLSNEMDWMAIRVWLLGAYRTHGGSSKKDQGVWMIQKAKMRKQSLFFLELQPRFFSKDAWDSDNFGLVNTQEAANGAIWLVRFCNTGSSITFLY